MFTQNTVYVNSAHFQRAAQGQQWRGFKRRAAKRSICTGSCATLTNGWVCWVRRASRPHTATAEPFNRSRASRSVWKINSPQSVVSTQMKPPRTSTCEMNHRTHCWIRMLPVIYKLCFNLIDFKWRVTHLFVYFLFHFIIVIYRTGERSCWW